MWIGGGWGCGQKWLVSRRWCWMQAENHWRFSVEMIDLMRWLGKTSGNPCVSHTDGSTGNDCVDYGLWGRDFRRWTAAAVELMSWATLWISSSTWCQLAIGRNRLLTGKLLRLNGRRRPMEMAGNGLQLVTWPSGSSLDCFSVSRTAVADASANATSWPVQQPIISLLMSTADNVSHSICMERGIVSIHFGRAVSYRVVGRRWTVLFASLAVDALDHRLTTVAWAVDVAVASIGRCKVFGATSSP